MDRKQIEEYLTQKFGPPQIGISSKCYYVTSLFLDRSIKSWTIGDKKITVDFDNEIILYSLDSIIKQTDFTSLIILLEI